MGLKTSFRVTGIALIRVLTLPYYRLYQFNTIHPIRRLAALTDQSQNTKTILHFMKRWRSRKLAELQFVSIACAVLAAAVIGSFSWSTLAQAYWVASALWYSSLILSILGILISAQQASVLEILGARPKNDELHEYVQFIRRYLPFLLREIKGQDSRNRRGDYPSVGIWIVRWKMVFVWQCPAMLMSYSVCFYLAGLTICVCTPFVRGDPWGAGSNIAIVYLAVATFAGSVFIFCGFWIYHYVDLEQDIVEADEIDAFSTTMSEESAMPFHRQRKYSERSKPG